MIHLVQFHIYTWGFTLSNEDEYEIKARLAIVKEWFAKAHAEQQEKIKLRKKRYFLLRLYKYFKLLDKVTRQFWK